MGSNSNNAADFQKGFNMVGDLFGMFDNTSPGTPIDYSGDYEEKAKMKELDAREAAMQEKRRAKLEAQKIHTEQESERAKKNTEWGRSGLADGGSKTLVQEGRRTNAREAEDDVRYEGDKRTGEIMDKGMRNVNLFRIGTGQTPRPTTLSLGSKLYDPRR